jgi:MarR family transcriptional regulator, organic hydroperoxide resistance regulator
MSNPLGSQFGSDQDSPGFMLWRVTNRWQAIIRAALQPFDLTHVQFVLLAALTWSREPLTQTDLAHRTRTDPMMTSQVLRALERKALIERHPHPSDGRARLLSVTPAGAALAQRANTAVEAADAAFFGSDSARPWPLARHLADLDERNRSDTPRPGTAHHKRDP